MKHKAKKITKATLEEWNACIDGFERFNQLFPRGADLKTASEGLIADGHPNWATWLWTYCKGDKDYVDQTTVTSGDYGTAIAGDEGTAIAGNYGTAIAGNFGTATAGDYGTATAGNYGTAITGYFGMAIAGNYGTAITGYFGMAIAGRCGRAIAGDEGAISILFWDSKKEKYIRKIGAIDGETLKPGVKYRLDENGNFIEAK